MTERPAAPRSLTLEMLRGIAALGVLARHAWGLDGTPLEFTDRGFPEFFVAQGATGVWLFFVLSGYVITRPFVIALMDNEPLPRVIPYAIRRGARIYPAYLVVLVVFLLLIGDRFVQETWQIPLHALLLHNAVPGEQQAFYNVSWTLSLEILFYAFVPLVAIAIRRIRRGSVPPAALFAGVIVLWALSAGWSATAAFIEINETSVWLRAVFPAMLSMFCPGIALAIAEYAARTDKRWAAALATVRRPALAAPAVVVLLAAAAVAGTVVDPLVVYEVSRQLFALAFGIVAAVAAGYQLRRTTLGRLGIWLGVISYGIYLWHGALAEIIYNRGWWVPATGPGIGAYGVRVVYLAALTIPLAWASWKFLEAPLLARARSGRAQILSKT